MLEPAYCGARKRQGGGTCRKSAGWGTGHPGHGRCRLHGGNTRGQVRHVDEQILEQQAREILAELEVAPVDDPLSELARIAGQAVAFKNAIGELVNRLDSIRYSTEGGEQLRAEVALFERALDRCGRILTAMARLNIDERLVSIEQGKAQLIANAVNAAIADMGLSAEQQRTARKAIVRELRMLSEEQDPPA